MANRVLLPTHHHHYGDTTIDHFNDCSGSAILLDNIPIITIDYGPSCYLVHAKPTITDEERFNESLQRDYRPRHV